ncbi:hypothetical protein B9Z55_004308 [Caenorhabditis nigoni]|uniref:G-protein coupled receptors family 1 profile domain-containing protein n=1 Tax=Caenorhabditis nigoni TaxID=1611254 RepID=A0A2G5UVW5_9PELO|nr:hypothetical protein B9Z55_004308 [Caenorhabditis nigoni]
MNLTEINPDPIEINEACAVESLDRRWYLVAVCGTSLSVLSIVSNMLISKVLLSSKHNHFYFLALLALSDCFLSLNYGPVIAMDIIKDRLQLRWLSNLYIQYVGPLLALSQTSMTFSCYLIILATIERYLITLRAKCLGTFRQCRGLSALCMFVLALLLRAPIIFEMQIEQNPECIGEISEYYLNLSPIVNTFWNIMTVLVPFALLAILNYKIVKILRTQQRSAQMFRFLSSDHKTKIRSATILMVCIVFSYLLANILNVGITLWEYVAFQSTQTGSAYAFYETCTDVTSVLYILVCATRLLVYYLFNQEIREAIKPLVCHSASAPRKDYVTVTRSLNSMPLAVVGALSFLSQSQTDVVRNHQIDSSRQIGTEIDAVAIAIARRLLSSELVFHGHGASKNESDSFVISNHHVCTSGDDECNDDTDDDDDDVPHMV